MHEADAALIRVEPSGIEITYGGHERAAELDAEKGLVWSQPAGVYVRELG